MPLTEARPFSIRIFLPGGEADGLQIIDKPNWTGCGLVCPRSVFPEARRREEFSRAGVYVLIDSPEDGALPTMYIGKADSIRLRLESHYRELDFWTWIVAFVSKDGWLNTAHIQYLEAQLVQRARETRRGNLNNANVPRGPALCESEQADVETFLEDMLRIFPLLGLKIFEQAPAPTADQHLFFLSGRGITARGYESPQGFVVRTGSQAVTEMSPSAVGWMSALHADLVARGVLVSRGECCEFAQDYVFASPSTAAGVTLGHEINGRTAWRDEAGLTLKEVQEAESSA